jgi:CheY-like chemotaxis protein
MPLGHGWITLEDAAPLPSLDSLGSLARIQRRAEVLGIELATLRRMMARSFVLLAPDDAAASEPQTIVVAHDHPVLRMIAAEILEELGYRVITTDGALADLPTECAIDALILDVPFVNEHHRGRIRRAVERSPRVVVATALPEGTGRQRLRTAGVVGFVAWPLDAREMAACLRAVLNASAITAGPACSG